MFPHTNHVECVVSLAKHSKWTIIKNID
jgi:hypothetical protein